MWKQYQLELRVTRLIGGIPRHPEIVARWQKARWPELTSRLQPGDPQTPEDAAEITVENLGSQAMSDEEVSGIWTGFMERDGSLVVEARQIKAMFKESANIVRTMLPVRGKVIPLRSRLAERVFVHPLFIPLGVAEPTDTIERPIHVMTAQGPRTALKRTDYVDDAKIVCELKVLNDGQITDAMLRFILDHAAENGLGTDRSQNQGTFEYTLTEV
jgi:hypothetical protein